MCLKITVFSQEYIHQYTNNKGVDNYIIRDCRVVLFWDQLLYLRHSKKYNHAGFILQQIITNIN